MPLSQLANPSVASAPLLIDGDEAFDGLNMKDEPSLLPPGTLARSYNKRLRKLSADQRPGISAGANQPAAVVDASGRAYYGSAVLRSTTPNGDTVENLIIAIGGANGAARKVIGWPDPDAGKALTTAAISGMTSWGSFAATNGIFAQVEFVQAIDKIYMLRGEGKTPYVLDLTNVAAGWVAISGPIGGTVLMPGGQTGELFQNRLLIPHAPEQLAVSDNLKYWQYDNILNDLYIEAGEASGKIVRSFPFGTAGVLIFKEHSIYFLSNFIPDSTQATRAIVSKAIGCIAPRTVVQIGGEVYFLSRRGVEKLSQVFEDRIAAVPIPISDPIQPLIDDLSLPNVQRAVAAVFGIYYVIVLTVNASVVSGAPSNTIICAYNTVTQKWESGDWIAQANVSIDALHLLTSSSGEEKLYALDYLVGYVARLYDPAVRTDTWKNALGNQVVYGIQDTMLSRGYRCSGLTRSGTRRKRYRRAVIAIATNKPSAEVNAYPHGFGPYGEKVALGTIAGSTTKSHIFGPAIVAAAHDPHAEDYDDGTLQESIFSRRFSALGRYLQIEVKTPAAAPLGSVCNVRSIGIEAKPTWKSQEAGA